MQKKIFTLAICLLSFLSVHAQTDSQNDFLTVKEAMDIVSYHRYNPMASGNKFDNVIKYKLMNHGYMKKDFLGEGIGTCEFWQFVKGGHVKMSGDQKFVPDDKQTASTVAVIDCEGVEGNGGDEFAITVELSVFSERSWAVLMRQMQDIGFEYKTSIDDWNVYVWHTYEIKVQKMIRNGYDCWEFDFGLTKRKYKTTRLVEFKDSTRSHNLTICLEYPVRGNPALLRQVRSFKRTRGQECCEIRKSLKASILRSINRSLYQRSHGDRSAVRLCRPDDGEADSCQATSCRILAPYSFASLMISSLRSRLYVSRCAWHRVIFN